MRTPFLVQVTFIRFLSAILVAGLVPLPGKEDGEEPASRGRSASLITIDRKTITGTARFSAGDLDELLAWDHDLDGSLSSAEFLQARADLEALGHLFFSLAFESETLEPSAVCARLDPMDPGAVVLDFEFPPTAQEHPDWAEIVFGGFDTFSAGHRHRLQVEDGAGETLLDDEIVIPENPVAFPREKVTLRRTPTLPPFASTSGRGQVPDSGPLGQVASGSSVVHASKPEVPWLSGVATILLTVPLLLLATVFLHRKLELRR